LNTSCIGGDEPTSRPGGGQGRGLTGRRRRRPVGEDAGDHSRNLLEIERLEQVVHGAGLHRPDGRIEVTERGHDDDGHVAGDLPDVGQRHKAVVGAQSHVEQDGVGVQPCAGGEGRVHVGRDLDGMAIVGEQLAQAPADGVLVVNDQDAAHGKVVVRR
jgi:hypothetical protein